MYWRKVGWLVWKDLVVELRAREFLVSMGVFGLLTLVLYNFSFAVSKSQMITLLPGLLWLAFVFAGMLGLNRSFAAEREHKTLRLLSLIAVDRSALFLGKLLTNLIYMFTMELLLTPVAFAFFGVGLPGGHGLFILTLVLGTVGFMALGTFVAALTVDNRAQEILMPVLLLPLLTPIVIGSVTLTAELMQFGRIADSAIWLPVLAAYDLIFLLLPLVLFDYLLEV